MRTQIRNICLLSLFFLQPAVAQLTFTINGMDGSNHREVSCFFNASNNQGDEYRTFTPGDFTVVEGGVERPVLRVSCPDPITPPLSVTYVFDISNSMVRPIIGGKPIIDVAKAAATALATLFDYPPANAGILGFDDSVYIHQNYTTNKQLVLDKIANVTTYGLNTNIYNAFMDPVKGAIPWTKNRPGRKFIVLFTDHYGRFTPTSQERAIYDAANAENITIITVLLEQTGITSQSLQIIANRTGGQSFWNIADSTQAVNIFNTIGYEIYQWPPCEMVYLSDGCETTRSATITLRKGGSSSTKTTTYTVPASKIVRLSATPSIVDFGDVPASQRRTIPVILKANNGPVTIEFIQSTTGAFFVKDYGGSPPPFTIPVGGTRTITIEYASPGDLRNSKALIVRCDAPCQDHISMAGGIIEDNALKVVDPNGGEKFFVNDLCTYRYTGVTASTPVNIEYSTNAGASWLSVTYGVTGYQRGWQVANTPSDSCIALIYSVDDKTTLKDSAWVPSHPASFTALDIAGMSTVLGVGREDGQVNIYYPYTGTLSRQIVAHNGAVHAMQFSNDVKWLATAGNDRRVKVWEPGNGNLVFQSTAFAGPAYGVAFSEDGQYMAGSDNNTVTLWRTSDWSEVWSRGGQASANGAVVIDPNLRWVASARGNDIVLLNFADGNRIASYTGHNAAVRSIDVTEDGWYLLSGGNDNTVRMWNTFLGTQVQALTSHSGNVNCVRFATGGLQGVSASDDNTVRVWNLLRGNLIYSYTNNTADVNAVDFGRHIGRIYTAGEDNTIRSFTYIPSMADRSDSLWAILAKITDITADTPKFDTLLCPGDFSEKTIWLRNSGNQPITVTQINITGPDAALFSITQGPTIPPDLVVQPEDSVSFTLRFQADVRGSYTAAMDFITDDPSVPALSVYLSGVKNESNLELSENQIDFGEYYHCSEPDTATAIVTNTGNVDITVGLNGTPISGPFTMLTQFPLQLVPGGTDTLRFVCAPDAIGDYDVTWQITGMPCNVTADLNVKASMVNSAPLPIPDPLVFNYTAVNDNSQKLLWLHNRTQVPIHVTSITVSGVPFSVTDPTAIPLDIAGNDSAAVSFTFTPQTEGTDQGFAVIISDSPCHDTVMVILEGSSSQKPSISASIDPFNRLVCATEVYDEQVVTVRNTGGLPLEISDFVIGGTHPADFTFQNPPSKPITIQPNGSETITVRFEPQDKGDRNATLTFTSNADNEPSLVIPLFGRRDDVSFTVTPPTMDFGEQYHCTVPFSDALTITNTGNVPITVSINPASIPGWMTIAPGTFPVSLNEGAQASIPYTVDIDVVGTYQATLAFYEPACNTTATADVAFSYADSKPLLSDVALDFGTLNISASDTRTVTLTSAISNATSVSAIILNGNAQYLTLTDPQTLPAAIAAGGQLQVTFQYEPMNDDLLDAEVLIITDSPCTDTLRVTITGEGKSAGTVVSLPGVTGSIGETVRIPITLEQSENLTLAGATSFIADIEFNASMLWVTDVVSSIGTVQFDTRVAFPRTELHIEVAGTNAPPLGVIAELVCIVALGDSDYTPLSFTSFSWPNTNVVVSTIDGEFTADGICRAGGNRFVGLSSDVELFQNAPNPFNPRTEIGFMLPEAMTVELKVYNTLGRQVGVLVNGMLEEGYHSATFEGDNLPSGIYIAVLRTGSGSVKLIRMLMTK